MVIAAGSQAFRKNTAHRLSLALSMNKSIKLGPIIGKRLRDIRLYQGLTQDAVATRMRERGSTWTRVTVAVLESGNRDSLTLEEVLDLSDVFVLNPSAFLLQPLGVHLSKQEAARLEEAQLILEGKVEKALAPTASRWTYDKQSAETRLRRHDWAWPAAKTMDLARAEQQSAQDALIKIARQMRMQPVAVALAALKKWEGGFLAERERRYGELDKGGTFEGASAQARRGHVSRRMIAELKKALSSAFERAAEGLTAYEKGALRARAEFPMADELPDASLNDEPTTKKPKQRRKK